VPTAATRRAYRAAGQREIGLLSPGPTGRGWRSGVRPIRRRIDATIRAGAVSPGLDTSAAGIAGVIVIGLDVIAVTVAIVVVGDGRFQSRAIEITLDCREDVLRVLVHPVLVDPPHQL
jgi:hypothetical protein